MAKKLKTSEFLNLVGNDHLFFAFDYEKKLHPQSDITDVETLHALNENGYCIFFAVNSMHNNKRDNKNTKAIRSIWVDDDKPRRNPRKKWPLPPSIIVKTSAHVVGKTTKFKHQYYWLTNTKEFDEFELVMQTMIDKHGNDKGVRDLARVLRLPGFNHMKDKENPFRVEAIGGSFKTHSWEKIKIAFPPAKHVVSSTKVKGKYNKKKAKEAIKESDDFHGSLRDRAMQLANNKLDPDEIVAILRADMETVPEAERDKRWQDRMSDEHLYECAISAYKKYENEDKKLSREEAKEIAKLESKSKKKIEVTFRKKLPNDIIAPNNTVIGELTNALHKTWWVPNLMVAGLAARSLVAYLGGGKYKSTSGDRMNIQQIAIGQTCSGKDLINSGPPSIIDYVFESKDLRKLSNGIVDEAGSAEGIDLKLRSNGRKHDILILLDEIGGLYKSALKDTNKRNFLEMLLKFYTKSNRSVSERPLVKKLPEGFAKTLYAPHVILSGATTPTLLIGGIGAELVSIGSFSRTCIFPVDPYREKVIEDIEELSLSDGTISKLRDLSRHKKRGLISPPVSRIKDPDICNIKDEARKLCYEVSLKNQNRKAGTERDIWNRQIPNAKMYAQIEAVAENPKDPVITVEMMQRNLDFVAYSCEYTVHLFSNEVAENDHELAKKKILQFLQNKKNKNVNIVTSERLRNQPTMRKLADKKWTVIKELIEDSQIECIEKENIRGQNSKFYKLL